MEEWTSRFAVIDYYDLWGEVSNTACQFVFPIFSIPPPLSFSFPLCVCTANIPSSDLIDGVGENLVTPLRKCEHVFAIISFFRFVER